MKPARFAILTLAYTLGVIAWGAFVRATGSGAGCGAHWPLCNGAVLPRPEAVETLIELAHRVTSGLALVAVLVLAVAVFRATRRGDLARLAATAAVLFMVAEAAIGAGLVLLEYVADDDSAARAYWMAGHLVNTFFLLAALAATVWWTGPGKGEVPAIRSTRAVAVAVGAAALLLLVGASGGVAALGDTLHPATSLVDGIRQDFAPGSALLLRLRVLHPPLAVGAGLALILTVPYLARVGDGRARPFGRAVVTLVVAQILAGSINLLLLAPIWLQIVHLVLADLLWLALVFFCLAVFTRPPGTPVAPATSGTARGEKMRRIAVTLACAGLVGSCAGMGLESLIRPPSFESVDGRGSEIRVARPDATRPLGGAVVRVWTRVRNPNPFGIDIAGLTGDLYLDDALAADVDLPLGLPLLASGDTVIPVDIAVDFADIPRIAEVVRDALGGGSLPYRVEGTVGVESETLGYHEFGPGTVMRGTARVGLF